MDSYFKFLVMALGQHNIGKSQTFIVTYSYCFSLTFYNYYYCFIMRWVCWVNWRMKNVKNVSILYWHWWNKKNKDWAKREYWGFKKQSRILKIENKLHCNWYLPSFVINIVPPHKNVPNVNWPENSLNSDLL